MLSERQFYYNIFSKTKFKSILEWFFDEEDQSDKNLKEKVLIGALAAVELDCIADMNNKVLNSLKTKKHYLEYAKIANKYNSDREDIKEFVDRIEKCCL